MFLSNVVHLSCRVATSLGTMARVCAYCQLCNVLTTIGKRCAHMQPLTLLLLLELRRAQHLRSKVPR